MNDAKELDEIATAIIGKSKRLAEEIHTIFEPQWESRAGILKTIISLSSGSIILSVTFSSSLRVMSVGLFWRWLILISFVLLVAALVLAFVALWIGSSVYGLQSNFLTSSPRSKKPFKIPLHLRSLEKSLTR